eukprot:tig00000863_g4990.t1
MMATALRVMPRQRLLRRLRRCGGCGAAATATAALRRLRSDQGWLQVDRAPRSCCTFVGAGRRWRWIASSDFLHRRRLVFAGAQICGQSAWRPPSNQIGSVELNRQIVDAGRGGDIEGLRALIGQNCYRFSAVNLSTAAYQLGQAAKRGEGPFDAEFALIRRRLLQLPVDHISARAVASLAYGAALAGYDDKPLLSRIQLVALGRINEFTPQGISNLLWALASLGAPRSRIFDATLEAWIPKIRSFKPQEAVCIVWAFVKTGITDEALARAVIESFRFRIPQLNPQDITLLLWALSKGSFGPMSGFMGDLVQHISAILPRFRPSSLPSVLLSLSSIGEVDEGLFRRAALQIAPMLPSLTAQQLANLVYAFARSGAAEPFIVESIAAEIDARLSGGGAAGPAGGPPERRVLADVEALATVAFSLGLLRYRNPSLFQKLARAALPQLPDASNQHLGMLAYAVSLTRFYDAQLAAGLMAEAEFRDLGALHPLVATRLVLCAATLRLGDMARPLVEALAAGGEGADEGDPQQIRLLVSLAYCVLVLEYGSDLLRGILMRIAAAYKLNPLGFTDLQLRHLYSICVALQVEEPALLPLVPAELLRRVKALHSEGQDAGGYSPPARWTLDDSYWAADDESPSGKMAEWRDEVLALLPAAVGPGRVEENLRVSLRALPGMSSSAPGGGWGVTVDFALPDRTAIVLHGPLRSLSKAHGSVPDGRTHLRMRLLRALGWRTALLSFHQWSKAPDRAARIALIRDLLR